MNSLWNMNMISKILKLISRTLRWAKITFQIKTDPIGFAKRLGVKIGRNVRIGDMKPQTFGTEPYLVEIGNHVTIASNVQFITHEGGVWVFRQKEPGINVYRRIKIGNNVFVGYGTIILPGVKVGNNVVIGAGSVVRSDLPDNCVAAGVPAKPIKSLEEFYRSIARYKLDTSGLSYSEIKKLLEIRKI